MRCFYFLFVDRNFFTKEMHADHARANRRTYTTTYDTDMDINFLTKRLKDLLFQCFRIFYTVRMADKEMLMLVVHVSFFAKLRDSL